LLKLLNPIYHADTPEKAARYRVEPYVIAADVYSVTPHIGRGGWTWYTGSAGWMYRVILEMILGIQRVGDSLMLEPVIPPDWPGFKIIYAWGSTTYQIEANVDRQAQAAQVWLDDHLLPDSRVPLTDDARLHQVYMKIPPIREIDEDDTARPK
jgi:cellobiose phosphorylase